MPRVCALLMTRPKMRRFTFKVELSAAYNQEQVYYYELDANRN